MDRIRRFDLFMGTAGNGATSPSRKATELTRCQAADVNGKVLTVETLPFKSQLDGVDVVAIVENEKGGARRLTVVRRFGFCGAARARYPKKRDVKFSSVFSYFGPVFHVAEPSEA